MTEKITTLREGIVEAARRWYPSGSNAEAELAALVQEYKAELPQAPSAAVRRSGEAAP
jgi:hypothetical protein